MKKSDIALLSIAAVAAGLVLYKGGVMGDPIAVVKRKLSRHGLSYNPGTGYGDTTRFDEFKPITNGKPGTPAADGTYWGIE